ncbi:MAG: hypothetical protein ACTHLY_21765, partial [Pseudolabrys sp.]
RVTSLRRRERRCTASWSASSATSIRTSNKTCLALSGGFAACNGRNIRFRAAISTVSHAQSLFFNGEKEAMLTHRRPCFAALACLT